jgi:hypothetical protein
MVRSTVSPMLRRPGFRAATSYLTRVRESSIRRRIFSRFGTTNTIAHVADTSNAPGEASYVVNFLVLRPISQALAPSMGRSSRRSSNIRSARRPAASRTRPARPELAQRIAVGGNGNHNSSHRDLWSNNQSILSRHLRRQRQFHKHHQRSGQHEPQHDVHRLSACGGRRRTLGHDRIKGIPETARG